MTGTPRREPQPYLQYLWAGTLMMVTAAFLKSAWGDETFTLRVAAMPLGEMFDAVARDSHPPLYFLIIKLLLMITDPLTGGDWVARLVVARLFSVACWMGTVLLGRRLYIELASRHPTRLIELTLTLAPAMMLFGRMARYYSLLALLFIYLMLLLIGRLKRGDEADPPGEWWKFSLAGAAMLLTAYLGAPLLAVLLIAAAAGGLGMRKLAGLLPRFALPFLALIPWLIFAWGRVRETAPAPGEVGGIAAGIKTMLVDAVYGTWVLTWGEHLHPVLWFIALPLLGALVLRVLYSLSAGKDEEPAHVRARRFTFTAVLLSIAGLALGAGFVFSLGTEFFPARLAFVAMPLTALALAALTRRDTPLTKPALWLTVLLVVIGSISAMFGFNGLQSTYDAPYGSVARPMIDSVQILNSLVICDSDAFALHYGGGDFGEREVIHISSALPEKEMIAAWDDDRRVEMVINPGLLPPDMLVAAWNEAHPERRFIIEDKFEAYRENTWIYRLKLRLGRARPTPCKLMLVMLKPFERD